MAFKNIGHYEATTNIYDKTDSETKSNDYVNFAISYIAENYANVICLNEIAAMAHLSSSYLSILFKKKMGLSFTEYLIRYRLNMVCEILKTESVSVKKAAEMVGYVDYAQFCKIFKKKVGVRPSEYRRKIKETE